MTGVRVELVVEDTSDCPVAETSSMANAAVQNVAWSSADESTREQFLAAASDTVPESVESVFSYDDQQVYEFTHDGFDECPCGWIESRGQPIADVRADEGQLVLTLHVRDAASLSDLLSDFRDRFGPVSIRSINHSGTTDSSGEFVSVDRGKLTDRQQEVLEKAHEMGYFEYPRQANASEVAADLDICPSTFAEHLAAAQSKLFGDLLEPAGTK